VGAGRLGQAFAQALDDVAWITVVGPVRRGEQPEPGCDAVLLCVPDVEIVHAAAAITRGPLVGHCSGATDLEPLSPHEAFSLHPLMTVTAAGADFDGVTAAIDGTSSRALELAEALAHALRMDVIRVEAADRASYHAAASLASNFLVTLEAAAERLAATAGVERQMLLPLVRATVENWAALGGERALTGPVARGDEATVARQREALAERTPDLLPLFDALAEATRALASTREPSSTRALASTRELEIA
jgi:predicted short-subunit dehydrogenase-like oxidoreductase (DUF2520 family)